MTRSLILTEGNKDIGFGHLTRCLSLKQALEKKAVAVELSVVGDDSVCDLLSEVNFCQYRNWKKSLGQFLKSTTCYQFIIVDSYQLSLEDYAFLASLGPKIIILDDNVRLPYQSGYVVNGTIFAEFLSYPYFKSVTYWLGSQYIPLRKSFWKNKNKKINDQVKKILVTFGGSDKQNLTPIVVDWLKTTYPKIEITTLRNFSEYEVKKIMIGADLAISAGGQTLYELASVGVPTIAIQVAKNQEYNIRGWQKAGFIEYAGNWNDSDLIDNLASKYQFLSSKTERKKRSLIGQKYVDGQGAKRIVRQILVLK